MVITRIHGGLGNQLFEYAAGHALARRLGVPHKVDLRVFAEAGERPLALREFYVPLVEPTPAELSMVAPQWGLWWRNKIILWGRRLTPFSRRRWVREETFDFDPRIATIQPPVYLDGWWQSEKYFSDRADEIRWMFQLHRPPTERTLALGAQLAGQTSVAVHVRRGDYVRNRDAARFHGVCSAAYYAQACSWMRERVPGGKFVVFSDDPAWARDNLKLPDSSRFISGSPDHSAIEDFFLLCCCTHFVIANSSFSWWPAWLGQTGDGLVVAPRRWFLGHDVRPEDRFPAGWKVIDA